MDFSAGVSWLLLAPMCWSEWHSESRPIMGAEVSVTVWHEDEDKTSPAMEAAIALMQSVDDRWNPGVPRTELYRVNSEAPGQLVAISPELTRIVDKVLYYSRRSDGAFDISFAWVGRYYDYRAGAAPDDQQLETALPAVKYRLLRLERKAQSLHFEHPDMRIDLGDRRGRPWMVGIRNPRKQGDVALVLPLQDVAFLTSGDYERFFIDENSGIILSSLAPGILRVVLSALASSGLMALI